MTCISNPANSQTLQPSLARFMATKKPQKNSYRLSPRSHTNYSVAFGRFALITAACFFPRTSYSLVP